MDDKINVAIKTYFRPEFLNRVDEIVIFNRLSPEHIRHIVDIQLRTLEGRLADKHISLELSGQAKDLLGQQGYDPVYGARPLKRIIQRKVKDPIALRILKGEFTQNDKIRVDNDHGNLVISTNGSKRS